MPSFLVPTLIHGQDCKNGMVPPILPHGVIYVTMARRLGDAPLPSAQLVSFRLTLDAWPVSPAYTTQSWPMRCEADLSAIPHGIHALSCIIFGADYLYQPFAVPVIVGAMQAPGYAQVCPGYQLQGIRRNEGAFPALIDLHTL